MGIEYLILLLVGQIAQGQEECNKLQNSPRPRTRTKSHLQETVCPMFYFIQVETCHPTLKCLVPQQFMTCSKHCYIPLQTKARRIKFVGLYGCCELVLKMAVVQANSSD